jgi:hypothetical protein
LVVPMIVGTYPGAMFWNLSHDVGPGCPNQAADVELVRLGYYCYARHQEGNKTPALVAQALSIQTTGGFDDILAAMIVAHQNARGGTQDRKISTIKNASASYHDRHGKHGMILNALVWNIVASMQAEFPRIDKHPNAGPALKAAVRLSCLIS